MFWLRNKQNKFSLGTLNSSPEKGQVALPEFCLKRLRYLLETGNAPCDIRGGAENLYLLYRSKFGLVFVVLGPHNKLFAKLF